MGATADLLLNILSKSDKRAISETADDLDKVARKADAAGKHFGGMADESRHLDSEIAKSKARLKELADEFDRTGERSAGFKRQLSGERTNLAWLEKLKKDLGDAGDQGGILFGSRLMNSISGTAPTGMVQWLVGGAVLAAPAVGAAISAGVLLGVGGGTLAGGIVAAAQDPRVKGAFGNLFEDVSGELVRAADVFVAPLQRSAKIFGDAFSDVLPDIRKDFDLLAPSVDHLASGVGNFARNMMPGFSDAVRESAPLLNQLADDSLPRMGSAMGVFFSEIAAGSGGAKAFLGDLTTGADLAVKQLGGVTLAMSKLYEQARQGTALGSFIGGTFSLWSEGLEHLDGSAKKAKESTDPLADWIAAEAAAADDAAAKTRELANSFETLASQAMGAQASQDNFNKGLLEMSDSVKRNGHDLRDNTEKGLANREMLRGMVGDAQAARQKAIEHGEAIDGVNAAYAGNISRLRDTARALHFTDAEVDALISSYAGVPGDKKTNVSAPGLNQSLEETREFARWLASLHDRSISVTTYIRRIDQGNIVPSSGGRRAIAGGGRVGHMASGGAGMGRYFVGESGPELVDLPDGSYVTPNNRLPSGGAAGELAEQVVRVILQWPDGSVIQEKLLKLARGRAYRSVDELLPVS